MNAMVETKVYSWSDRRFGRAVDAKIVGPILEKMGGDGCSAEDVLNEAKKKSSPLHPAFEWNESKAAHEYRLAQARGMLRSLRIEVVVRKQDAEPKRAFVIVSNNSENQRYMPVQKAMSNAEMRKSVLRRLKMELISFAKRNAEFREDEELGPIFRAIMKLKVD